MNERIRQTLAATNDVVQSEEFQQFRVNATDFLSARERGGEAAGTRIDQMVASLDDVAEVVNRSFAAPNTPGEVPSNTNIISPVVIPKDRRTYRWVAWVLVLVLFGVVGQAVFRGAASVTNLPNIGALFFGPHYWLLVLVYAGFSLYRNSFAMIPDGCQALITRFGKLEAVAGAGRVWLLNPWTRVSYVINTTKEYPYNAPIREAPTASGVNASVDLFLQFKIDDPASFIFSLGGVKGFTEKLQNAISEVTRALIYEQKAEDIYDLVGESTQTLLDSLNQQFLPAVRFVNANITHAEPASQEYRIDLAAPEMVRVAKEAYTYQYELKLRKEQDEGDLNRELASLREQLSAIKADVATFQAQINTAREKETHRANAYARQLMVEAESAARANAALAEAQALDIRAVSGASHPEIWQYRFQQSVLDKLQSMADHLPQVVQIGDDGRKLDYSQIARELLGIDEQPLYTETDLQSIRSQIDTIRQRIVERGAQLRPMLEEARVTVGVEDEGGAA